MAEKIIEGLPPHAEDVIFNKPSLKELIRLVKNGSITAIWPSTEQEFRDWNNGGYTKYAKGKPLKSLKTAMTVYYGDNQDIKTTGDINIEETTAKYNNTINSIEEQKNAIVSSNYYDSTSQIYPSSVSLSLDNSTGNITNSTNLVNYHSTIINNYKQNVNKINEFISRIENFTPTIDATDLGISDTSLESDYQKFFTDSTDIGMTALSAIPNHTWSDQDVENALVLNNTVFLFENIHTLYEEKRTNMDNIISSLIPYYNNLTYDAAKFLELDLLESNYKNNKLSLDLDLNTYFQSWGDSIVETLRTIMTIQIPLIRHYELSEEDKNKYENDINQLFTDKVTPYRLLTQYLFGIKNPGSTSQDKTDFWNNVLSQCQDAVNNVSSLQDKIEIINNNLISQINLMAQNIGLEYLGANYKISFMVDGTIDKKDDIFNALQLYYNAINYEYLILNNTKYSALVAESYQPIAIPNRKDCSDDMAAIKNHINNILTNLKDDQNKVTTLYNAAMQEYQKFIQELRNLTIIPINTVNFSLSINGIDNISQIYNTIINQKEKVQKYLEVARLTSTSYNVDNGINTIFATAQSITNRLNNAKIIVFTSGSSTDFNNKLLKAKVSDSNYDYTLSSIKNLIKRITNNNTTYMNMDESQLIPQPSSNYLTISNKTVVLNNLYAIKDLNDSLNREYNLYSKLHNIESILNAWSPIYDSLPYTHYTCIAVGSDIKFDNEIANSNLSQALSPNQRDGSITIIVDEEYHYPLINNMANTINSSTRNSQVLTVGGLASLFGGTGSITNRTVGSTYYPVYISNGQFTPCAGVVSGNYITQTKANVPYWKIMHDTYYTQNGELMHATENIGLQATKLFGAVFNDYAEYRNAAEKPGSCVIENGDGSLSASTKRLQLGASIVSDTFGFAIGETDEATCPIAVSGRVLAIPFEDITKYTPGAAVCSGPNGTISIMTREEIREWPDAIVGYVSEIPTYDTWGTDNVPVNGRIWIKIK